MLRLLGWQARLLARLLPSSQLLSPVVPVVDLTGQATADLLGDLLDRVEAIPADALQVPGHDLS